jgi:hypothetical protein
MPRSPRDGAQLAVQLMNVWLDSPDGPPDRFVSCLLRSIDARSTEEGLTAAVELIMGMSHLSGALLVLVEEATGSRPRDTLEEFALLYELA